MYGKKLCIFCLFLLEHKNVDNFFNPICYNNLNNKELSVYYRNSTQSDNDNDLNINKYYPILSLYTYQLYI